MINDFEKNKEDLIMELNSYKEAHQQLVNSAAILRMRYNKLVNKIKEEIEKQKEMKVDGEIFTTAVNYAIKVLGNLLEELENEV